MNRPNILLITTDQQHWSCAPWNMPSLIAPNLARLAREGLVLDRTYCTNPTCTPSRASIITGLMPNRHGAWSIGTALPETVPTIGTRLGCAGYATSLVGKAHFQPLLAPNGESLEGYPLLRDLSFWRKFSGPYYGFEHVELARNHGDECHAGQHYAVWMEDKGCRDWARYFQNSWCEFEFPAAAEDRRREWVWEIPEPLHQNAWIAERTNARIADCAGAEQPFFHWASFFDPHPPYLAPARWAELYSPDTIPLPKFDPSEHSRLPPHFAITQHSKPDFSAWHEDNEWVHGLEGTHLRDPKSLRKDIAVYFGMVSMLDHYIGQILDHLDDLKLSDNTLVVFTSDHGHYFGQHGLTRKGPFHFEDGIRVPTAVRMPGKIPGGRRSAALTSLLDLPATFCTAAGVEGLPGTQGVDQWPVWTGEKETARNHVVVEHRNQPTTIHMKTFVDDRYKLTVYLHRPYGELFDLEADPTETHNLWDVPECRGLREHLIKELLFAGMESEPLGVERTSPA